MRELQIGQVVRGKCDPKLYRRSRIAASLLTGALALAGITIMTHTQKPAVSCGVQGCTNTGVGHPTHGGIKGAGGGVVTVP